MPTQPRFWTGRGIASTCLLPVSLLYALATGLHRRITTPKHLAMPVISIGNVTAGGAGKTPTTIAIAKLLQARNHRPHILSRGYGAQLRTPLRVSTAASAEQVGDEALLLAQAAPTWVCPDRIASGDAAVAAGANIILCDDALQHHRLHKDINLLVIDGAYGIGNGRLLPAGPLRETFTSAQERCDAIILIGNDAHGLRQRTTLPVFTATLQPVGDTGWLREGPVTAVAGIARPQKFYDTLASLGATIATTYDFPDHHPFTEAELAEIIPIGTLVTTEKDWVRLPETWRSKIRYVPVALQFEDAEGLTQWLEARLDA